MSMLRSHSLWMSRSPHGLDLLTLTKVCSKGDHFQSALYLEPFGDDRSIQTTGVGEDDAFDIGHGGTLLLRARR